MTRSEAPSGAELARAAWSQRVRRVGGFIQLAFAAFWLIRGALSLDGAAGTGLAAVAVALVVAVLVYGIRVTAGTGRRPTGPEAKRIERSVTIATVIELVASFALPVIVIAAGHRDWVLPSIAITIGPLLLWLDHVVHIPRYRPVGSVLTIGPFILVATMSGTSLAATTGLVAGVLLLGTAAAGFHDLAKLRAGRSPKIVPLPAPTAVTTPEVHTQSGRFRPFFNPATGEHIQFTAVGEDNRGELVRFNWRSVPGGVITEHIHPHQEERFTITAGQARFTLNGEEHLAAAGQTVVVPAGVPHSEGNTGTADIEGVVELRPALKTKEFHEAVAGLVADGNTTPRGAPKNPLQLGATFWHFRHESRATSPPIWFQNLMLPPLAALAKLVGVDPYNQRWDSRVGPSPASGTDPTHR